jgi:hypothetical protein
MEPKPLSYELNRKACEKFINAADEEVKDICRKIINNTQHISYERFILSVNDIIDEYFETFENLHFELNRPIFIFTTIDETNKHHKYKSNYWIIEYLIKRMHAILKSENSHCKIIMVNYPVDTPEIQEGDTIIFVDDCIYSGSQLGSSIKKFKRYEYLYNLFIMVPYGSRKAIDHIMHSYKYHIVEDDVVSDNNKTVTTTSLIPYNLRNKRHLKSSSFYISRKKQKTQTKEKKHIFFSQKMTIIKSVMSILTPNECKLFDAYYNGDNSKEDKFFSINSYMIYFDHKLADPVSIPTLFYLGIVPNKRNKKILSRTTNVLTVSDKLQIIPIINNCESYTTIIDPYSPKCPYPPYKEGYKYWLEDMKDYKLLQTKDDIAINKQSSKSKSKTKSI